MKTAIEIFGWLGMVMILVAYALLSFSVLPSNSLTYQLLNVVGSIAIAVVAYTKRAYQPMVLNIVWAFIAAVVILRIFLY